MAKPQIRHLAIMTVDPEKLAKFYEQVFEMQRIPRAGAGGSKAIYMTDGYITLALLHNRADGRPSGASTPPAVRRRQRPRARAPPAAPDGGTARA